MPSDYPKEVTLTLKVGEMEQSLGSFAGDDSNAIVSLGKHEKGQLLELTLTLKEDRLSPMIGENYFYRLDLEAFEDAFARLGKDQYQITEYTEHSFLGSFTASREKELVLTTIPYDRGWKITVDGCEVEPIKALGSVIAFYVEGNANETHTIELNYSPKTLWVGLMISLVSIGILTLLCVFRKRVQKIKFLRAVVAVPEQSPSIQTSKKHPRNMRRNH